MRPSDRAAGRKLAVLAALYAAQGLPFGFFNQCIPVMLRQSGASLMAVALTNLLSLPWVLKALWAPVFDRAGLASPAARRWLVLGLQLLAAAVLLAGAGLDPYTQALPVFAVVVLSNLCSATQDIPTDAMTVEALGPADRGLGNGAQVAGYRLGMVVGGGVLLAVLEQAGWSTALALLAAAMVAAAVPLALHGPLAPASSPPAPEPDAPAFFADPAQRGWFVALVVYKLGDAFGTGSIKPMLVDFGYGLSDVGWLLGTLGSGAAVAGSMLGGAAVTRVRRALPVFAGLQAGALALWVAASLVRTTPWVAAAVAGEHFFSGMATTALFTAMMARCRPGRAAGDYTAQASVVLIAQGVATIASGSSAETLGHTWHLALGCVIALVAALLPYERVAR